MPDLKSIKQMIRNVFDIYFQDNDKCNLAIQFSYIVSTLRNNKGIILDANDYASLNLMENVLKNN